MKHRGYYPAQGFAFNPYLKYPRNKECYCGSDKKYKKCCLLTEPIVIQKDAESSARNLVNKIRAK